MKTSFKRAAAWLLTVLMILSCVPALATESVTEMMEGSISLFDAVSTYDVDGGVSTLAIGKTETLDLEVGKSYTITSDTSGNPAASGTYSSHIESWESSNTGVATVTGITNSDNQYKQTQATIKGVSVGTATITHTYYTADYSEFIGAYYNWQTQTETVTVNVSNTPNYTVTFDIGTEAESAGVEKPASVMVQSGKTLTSLPAPEWKDQDGQYVRIFAGWYSDESLTAEFTSSTPVESGMTLYAYWVDPDVDEMYYVNFLSQDGPTVHLTLAVRKGQTVNPASGPVKSECVFKGWSTEKQEGKLVSELNAFDFTAPVSDSDALAGNTLNLYAWYAPAVKVSFISNGGSAVPTQFLAAGETATNVTPTRTGYTFEGWYTDKELEKAFDFTNPVNADITLYAKWMANMVPVTLVYMYENADDENYSPAGKSKVVYAPAGSYVSIEKSKITSIGQTHAVRYSDTADGDFTGYASTAATGGKNATIEDVLDTYFQYETATNKRQVMPDGSTVMLVYYNRARITLTFTYNLSSNASMDVDNLISAEDQKKYNVVYTPTTSGGYNRFTYSFTAKYGENIVPVWARTGWVTNDSSEGNTFYTWNCPDGHQQTSNMYTLEDSLFKTQNGSGLSISDGKLVGSGTLKSGATNVKEDWLIYARTTLPGETVDFTYGGKDYTIYTEACQLGYTGAGTFGYKALDGCTPYSGEPTLTAKYGNNMRIENLTVKGGSLKNKYDAVFSREVADGTLSANETCQVLLYDRNTVQLSVWANDTAHPAGSDPQTQNYLYGDWIYNEETDWLKGVENAMAKEGYRFAGWFTDPNFTPGTEYKLDENTRINGNLNLYAKWEPNQFLAEYYLYMDDTTPYATQGFAEGGKIDDKIVPVAVQTSFLGWYWYDERGHLVPFDFTSTVGKAHVDSEGVLKLYAKWKGSTGKVSYLPGIGGDNSTQEVFDSRDFEINEAAVQLPVHTKVWTDGSVPSDKDLTFVGWKAPNGRIYQPGRYVLVTRQLMQFEAQWSKDAVQLIYDANGGVGENVTETWERSSVVDIWDNMDSTTPHFTRDGYELLGWDENMDATVPTYKLGEGTITLTANTTTLYAIWKKSTTSASIQKNVSGNFGDVQRGFTFKVKVVDENGASVAVDGMDYGADGYYRFTLMHGETQTLNNLPIGNKLYFHEENAGNYTQTVNQGDTSITTNGNGDYVVTISEEMATIMFNNKYDVTPDTGVVLDSLPYIVILVIVLVGVVLMVRRRRREDD